MSDKTATTYADFFLRDKKRFEELSQEKWFILQYFHRCRKGEEIPGLSQEAARREEEGDTSFEVFRPQYKETIFHKGKKIDITHDLMFNYVFIKYDSFEKLKLLRDKVFPKLNFAKGKPYLNGIHVNLLRWIAESFNQDFTFEVHDSNEVKPGDKVRIIKGEFEGLEGVVEFQTGGGSKNVMVRLANWASVPLMGVKEDEYVIIKMGGDTKRLSTKAINTRLSSRLHDILIRFYHQEITEEDKEVARKAIREYGYWSDTSEYAERIYVHLLIASKVLAEEEQERFNRIVHKSKELLKSNTITNITHRSQLLITLYGCTNDFQCYQQVRQLKADWIMRKDLTKMAQILLDRADDYENYFDPEGRFFILDKI